MKRVLSSMMVLVVLLALAVDPGVAQGPEPTEPITAQAAVGTAFTYQGRLTDGGSLANGSYDFRFILYDNAVGGSQVGSIVTVDDQAVTEGLFTVLLDFGGSAFTGSARWLEVAVRPGASTGAYTILSPRQALTPAPYALNADLLDGQHASAFWKLTSNSGTSPGTHLLGTTDNQALEFRVNGARTLRLEPSATSPNLIGGYNGNSVTSGVVGATIGGGGASGLINRVTDDYGLVGGGRGNRAGDNAGTTSDNVYAAIGGGRDNFASASYSTIGGGYGNLAADYATIGGGGRTNPNNLGTGNRVGDNYGTVSGGGNNQAGDGDADPTNARYATVGGGWNNTASNNGATVGGGWNNTASDNGATVGGGYGNIASGGVATIAGGRSNSVGGDYATVGGGWDNDASGQYATVPGGRGASASRWGEMAYASGEFDRPGDAQTSVYVLRNTTTNATPTEVFLDGVTRRLTIISSATVVFDILVVARSSGDSSAGYVMRGIIENDDGWTHFIGTPSVIAMGEDRPGWDVEVTADNANDALVITVTGEAGYTIHWVATVRTVEVWH